jgi:hypothetical protein
MFVCVWKKQHHGGGKIKTTQPRKLDLQLAAKQHHGGGKIKTTQLRKLDFQLAAKQHHGGGKIKTTNNTVAEAGRPRSRVGGGGGPEGPREEEEFL